MFEFLLIFHSMLKDVILIKTYFSFMQFSVWLRGIYLRLECTPIGAKQFLFEKGILSLYNESILASLHSCVSDRVGVDLQDITSF